MDLLERACFSLDTVDADLSVGARRHFLVGQEQKDSLNAHAVEYFAYFGRGGRRVDGALHVLRLRIVYYHGIVVKTDEQVLGLVLPSVGVVFEAFAEANDVLLGDEVRGDEVADQAYFNLVFEDHGVHSLVDKLHILD